MVLVGTASSLASVLRERWQPREFVNPWPVDLAAFVILILAIWLIIRLAGREP